jgi:uncharacterized protein (DUF2235 family)
VYNAVRFPFTNANNNGDLHIVRHAMSIDERRAFFRQNAFREPNNDQQDIKEVWFAGVHSDVGGSYHEDQSQLSRIALRWMINEAGSADLRFDPARKEQIIQGAQPEWGPNPDTRNQHKSLKGVWWIAEIWPKISHKKNAQGEWKKGIRLNWGRRRYIPPDPVPLVHQSVKTRMEFVPAAGSVHAEKGLIRNPFPYKPGNLPATVEYVEQFKPFGAGAGS